MKNPELERCFRSVANRKRLEILQLLARESELPPRDIAERIRLSPKSTHKHLQQLLQTGYVEKERRRDLVFYHLDVNAPALHKLILKFVLR